MFIHNTLNNVNIYNLNVKKYNVKLHINLD